jgi:hypothetical protein
MTFEATGPTSVRPRAGDVVESRFLGRLVFKGGYPTEETLRELYDRLDFQRGCQVFLRHVMGAAVWGFQQGWRRDLDLAPPISRYSISTRMGSS